MALLLRYRRRISLLWIFILLLLSSSCFISFTSAGLMTRRDPGDKNEEVAPAPAHDEQHQEQQQLEEQEKLNTLSSDEGGATNRLTTSDNENESFYDERTLLDTFGEFAKEYFTQKIIPTTDIECKWDWRFVRCEPYCECDYLPQRGDYHLGRSCRISIEKLDHLQDCNPYEQIPTDNTVQLMIQKVVRNSQKAIDTISNKVKEHYSIIQDRVCTELPDKVSCDVANDIDDDTVILAWQERLLCRHLIPDCSQHASTTTTATASSSSTTSTLQEDFDERLAN